MQHLCKNIETLWQPFNLTGNFVSSFFLFLFFEPSRFHSERCCWFCQTGWNGLIEHIIFKWSRYYFLTQLDKYNMYIQSLTLITITCSMSGQINIQTSSRRKYPMYLQNQKNKNKNNQITFTWFTATGFIKRIMIWKGMG